jgi:RNA polymerase sigma factor (sigma-70 family)
MDLKLRAEPCAWNDLERLVAPVRHQLPTGIDVYGPILRANSPAILAILEQRASAILRNRHAVDRETNALDVAHEFCDKMRDGFRTYDVSRPFCPFAAKAVFNGCMELLRRFRKDQDYLPSRALIDEGPSVHAQVEARELRHLVEKLPPELSPPVLLRYFADMTSAEAAAKLRVSPSIIDQQTFKARAMLRKRLGKAYFPGAA